MEEKYHNHMKWWLDEFNAGNQVDHYVKLFPELKTRLAKFAVGIFLWNMKGLIDIDNSDDVERVRSILKEIEATNGYHFFDNVFNEATPDIVSGILGLSPMALEEEDDVDYNYTVSPIESYNDATEFREVASWEFVISEELFKQYTVNGNRIYVCQNEGWWDVPCVKGKNFPHDKFGHSLIAVEVTPDNEIASVTSRWNTYAGLNGDFLSPEDLHKVIGDKNFKNLFFNQLKNENGDII